jgi:hypothetical protein
MLSTCLYENQETDAGTVGNVTGSKEWQESGKKDAQEGINEMKVCPSFGFHSLKMCRLVDLRWLADVLGR